MFAKVKIWSPLLFVVLLAGMLGACMNPAPEVPPTSEMPSGQVDRVEVVYFHRPQRCQGCIHAEEVARYTLGKYFQDKLGSGQVTWRVINLGDSENAAIVKKYSAYTSSLFINVVKDGTDHIEEVMDIWFLLDDDEAFIEVVRSSIENGLKEIE